MTRGKDHGFYTPGVIIWSGNYFSMHVSTWVVIWSQLRKSIFNRLLLLLELLKYAASFMCSVLQIVQTVRDGDLPEEGAPALHRLCEGERSAVPAHLPHAGRLGRGSWKRRCNDPLKCAVCAYLLHVVICQPCVSVLAGAAEDGCDRGHWL